MLLRDILVDVLVSPVKHKLLLLSLIHPHDGSGDLLDDALKLTQLTHTVVGHFLRQTQGEFIIMTQSNNNENT